jgi:hypothetical protein
MFPQEFAANRYQVEEDEGEEGEEEEVRITLVNFGIEESG